MSARGGPRRPGYGDPAYDRRAYDRVAPERSGYDRRYAPAGGVAEEDADGGYDYDAEPVQEDVWYEPEPELVAAPRTSRPRGAPPVRPARRRRQGHPVIFTFLLIVLLGVVVAGGVAFERARRDIVPAGASGSKVAVDIPSGASTQLISTLLSKAGVIHGATLFKLYVRLEGDSGKLLPGTYHLPTNERYSKVITALEAGPPVITHQLIVPEGFDIHQIAARVAQLPGVNISAKQLQAAATTGVRSRFEPAGIHTLEGLLFPATYPVQPGETADALVEYMVQTFDQHAAQLLLTANAKKLGYTPYQVVEVASIIEREAKLQRDRPIIAGIIYNRLAAGMPLGADSTLTYALGDPNGSINYNQPNPYNTRLHKGLPPTAISNPGLASLQAALHPARTNDLYWVEINPDGEMGFASTASGFAQLQAECRAAGLGC